MEVHHDKLNQVPSTKYLIALCLALNMGITQAATIRSPALATASSEFAVFFEIGNTIDQSGLSSNFIDGVTDFDTYILSNPLHTQFALNTEWFSAFGDTAATVTYDLGAIFSVDRLAIWNEEQGGIDSLDVLSSTDGINFTLILDDFTGLTDNPSGSDYPADVVDLSGIFTVKHIRLEMNCQPSGEEYNGCSMGEFAVSDVGATSVPANTDYAWGALTLLASGMLLRRRSTSTTTA